MNIAPASSPYSPSPLSVHSSSHPALKSGASSSSLDPDPYSSSVINGPYMGVVLVVLLITFFLMAAFSVYMRRYAFALDNEAAARAGTNQAGRGMGLDRATIDGLPMVVYHCGKGEKGEAAAVAAAAQAASLHEWSRRPDCVVCLADFEEAEKLRVLPRCEHCFHSECIDMWLFSHSTCPLCRLSLLQPPPPTPPPPAAAAAAAANEEVCISVQAPRPAPAS